MSPDPRSPYAVSKLAAEYYVRTIGGLWRIETVCMRVFNAYGPGQQLPASHAPVVPRFLHNALIGQSLVAFGDGFVEIEIESDPAPGETQYAPTRTTLRGRRLPTTGIGGDG